MHVVPPSTIHSSLGDLPIMSGGGGGWRGKIAKFGLSWDLLFVCQENSAPPVFSLIIPFSFLKVLWCLNNLMSGIYLLLREDTSQLICVVSCVEQVSDSNFWKWWLQFIQMAICVLISSFGATRRYPSYFNLKVKQTWSEFQQFLLSFWSFSCPNVKTI